MRLQNGDKAPFFRLPSADGIEIALQDLLSKKVVVYFYPKDNTPGCTIEAEEFSALLEEFSAKNAIKILLIKNRSKCFC